MPKLKRDLYRLLFEAYRRLEMMVANCDTLEQGKPLTKRWVGLGTAAAYKPALEAGLMVFFDGKTPPPRCAGWLCLTEKGVTVLWDHRHELENQHQRLISNPAYQHSVLSQYTLTGALTA